MAWPEIFFTEIERGSEIKMSAEIAGVTRQTIYYHIWNTPWFRERLRQAKKDFTRSHRPRPSMD